MYSSNEWHHNSDGEFGHASGHSIGDRSVDICRPDTDNSDSCCGCVRKGQYPCEYQEIGGEPPPVIANCFIDPTHWDDSGTVCLNKDDAKCCPLPDFSVTGVQQWSPLTKRAFGNDPTALATKEAYWADPMIQSGEKGVCYPSVEGGMCKYTDSNGLSLFYNYVDGEYEILGDDPSTPTRTTTTAEREEGRNVKKLLNYPMATADYENRDPPRYTNLCDRNNWGEANILFHQMTTQAGQDYYIDDYRERRSQQRVASIGRETSDGSIMTADDLLGDQAVRDRFGSNLLSPFGGGRGSFFDDPQYEPQWDREEADEADEADEAIPGTTPTSVTYGFTIPEGKAGGDTVRVRLTDGTLVQFTLPANGGPGMNIQFKVSA